MRGDGMIEPPSDTPEYAHGMWACALFAAIQTPQMVAAFEQATGKHYSLPKAPIEQMIDEASGFQSEYFHAFGEWFNREVWGPWDGKSEEK